MVGAAILAGVEGIGDAGAGRIPVRAEIVGVAPVPVVGRPGRVGVGQGVELAGRPLERGDEAGELVLTVPEAVLIRHRHSIGFVVPTIATARSRPSVGGEDRRGIWHDEFVDTTSRIVVGFRPP